MELLFSLSVSVTQWSDVIFAGNGFSDRVYFRQGECPRAKKIIQNKVMPENTQNT